MLVKQVLLLSIDLVAMWAIFVKNLMLPQKQNKNKDNNCKNTNTNNKQKCMPSYLNLYDEDLLV